MKLSTKPPRGTVDWMPDEFSIRYYIFQTRRRVCQSFGYEEYLAPLVENADLYRAKSGEDVGGTELTLIHDRGGREIAIRPEMTPSVTRMVAGSYSQLPKPVKYFSIANFYRNEKPQRGRNREFWQLNVDCFGEDSLYADIEILQMGIEIMFGLGAPDGSFELHLNHRVLIDDFLENVCHIDVSSKQTIVRLLDKWNKMSAPAMKKALGETGCDSDQIDNLFAYMKTETLEKLIQTFPVLKDCMGLQELVKIQQILNHFGYGDLCDFSPSLMRGFDYYDGMIFEVFDTHPDNKRAMFGGGRYNGLAGLFGKQNFSAVGFAPGDEPTKLFLESRDLVDNAKKTMKQTIYYIPLLQHHLYPVMQQVGNALRKTGYNVEMGLSEKKLGKALQYADKKGYEFVVIVGEDESRSDSYRLKNMITGEEKIIQLGNVSS